MFERLTEAASRAGERRALARAAALADQMSAELPRGIEVQATADAVVISGRAVKRRFAIDPALRWLTARLR